MFCTNCGHEIDPKAVICVHCGVRVASHGNYCKNCGAQAVPNAASCVKCGTVLAPSTKSRLAAGLFGIFLGCFGVHNFYLGYHGKAIAQLLLTLLTCGIGATVSSVWGLVEGIIVLTDSNATDASGIPLND